MPKAPIPEGCRGVLLLYVGLASPMIDAGGLTMWRVGTPLTSKICIVLVGSAPSPGMVFAHGKKRYLPCDCIYKYIGGVYLVSRNGRLGGRVSASICF